MIPAKKLKGERLFLGPIEEEHIPILYKWVNDMDVLKYLSMSTLKLDIEAEKAYIRKAKSQSNYHYYGIFVDDKLIGSIDFKDVHEVHRTAMLGIVIGEKEYWDKGYGTEAMRLLLDYGFNVLNLKNVMLTVYEYNERALHVYKKVGFKEIGRRRKSRFFDGTFHDEIYMDIVPEDL